MKISVITVAFNSANTIRTTIDSVLSQNIDELEYIIIDGGSTDKTLSIIDEFSSPLVVLVSEPDLGIYDAMNKGIERASGDVVAILNSDDFYCHDNVLNEVLSAFSSNPNVDLVMGNVEFAKGDNLAKTVRNYRVGKFQPWMLRFGLMPPHPGVFMRKSVYDHIGTYKLGYKIAADFDFLTRALLKARLAYSVYNSTWVKMRVGGASTRGLASNFISTKEMLRSLKENGVYSNFIFLCSRLPVKFIKQVVFKSR